MIKLFVAGCTLVLLLQLSCKDNAVGPVFKDPRTYTWTIDTLSYPGSFQTNMQDVWGSSATDVYVVGHNDQNRGLMWHFDGNKWSDIKLSTVQGGNIQGPIDLSAVYGFGVDNILAVGDKDYDNPNPPPNFLDSSLIIHFDGRQWNEQRIQGGRLLRAIWGNSPSSLWIGGWTNTVFHYDGSAWKRDSLPVTVQSDGFFQVEAFEGNASGEVYAIGNTHQNSTSTTIHYFFVRQRDRWLVVDSFFVAPSRIEWKWGQQDLWVSPSGILYSCGRGVHRWNGSNWEMLFDHPNLLTRVIGTGEENVFVVGHLGTVLHYDGRNWYQYEQLANPDLILWGVWTDGKEVMVVGYTATFPQKTIILHGK
jgi:hypothetical protein